MNSCCASFLSISSFSSKAGLSARAFTMSGQLIFSSAEKPMFLKAWSNAIRHSVRAMSSWILFLVISFVSTPMSCSRNTPVTRPLQHRTSTKPDTRCVKSNTADPGLPSWADFRIARSSFSRQDPTPVTTPSSVLMALKAEPYIAVAASRTPSPSLDSSITPGTCTCISRAKEKSMRPTRVNVDRSGLAALRIACARSFRGGRCFTGSIRCTKCRRRTMRRGRTNSTFTLTPEAIPTK
mmetsp:Transcript_12437/g.28492  ORF Transcript_12437/g.28492 Transcript_12437/m.28492 type:complete len:238 (+) Transcript_12437:658-1371(+)